MERGRSLFIVKVKFQGHWAFTENSGINDLNPCGQDIARTIQPRLLKLSMYTQYGKRKRPINFQGQRSHFKVTGPLQRILALGSLWARYSKNYTA